MLTSFSHYHEIVSFKSTEYGYRGTFKKYRAHHCRKLIKIEVIMVIDR